MSGPPLFCLLERAAGPRGGRSSSFRPHSPREAFAFQALMSSLRHPSVQAFVSATFSTPALICGRPSRRARVVFPPTLT